MRCRVETWFRGASQKQRKSASRSTQSGHHTGRLTLTFAGSSRLKIRHLEVAQRVSPMVFSRVLPRCTSLSILVAEAYTRVYACTGDGNSNTALFISVSCVVWHRPPCEVCASRCAKQAMHLCSIWAVCLRRDRKCSVHFFLLRARRASCW